MNKVASKFGTSQSVPRREDVRFLTGRGTYMEEAAPAGSAHAVFVRSPVAHARIASIDLEAARAMPGVLAVYGAADLAGGLENAMDFEVIRNRDGSDGAAPRRPMLAGERVCHLGEAVAMVVAETRHGATDAAEAVAVDYDDLPVHLATAPGGTTIHPEAPGNVAYDWAFGDEAAVAATFERAAFRTRLELVDNRVFAMPLEARGCAAKWDGERLQVAFSGQGVWGLRDELAEKLALAPEQVRVTTPDVGGGFGIKGATYPEYFLTAFAARALGRPVFWMSGRGEAMLSDNGCRDHVTVAEAAFDADYRLQAIRIDCVSNLGAYNAPYGQGIASLLALKVMPGVYDVQQAFFRVRGVFTNTTPTDAYRGAGRPEAIYVIERLIDWSARDLGLDPFELRRRNFIPREAFPYKAVSGEMYDVGDFERVLDRAVAEADVAGFPARRAASAAEGRLRGIGLAYYIESILGAQNETTAIVFAEDGMVELHVGTQSNGQGHETAFAQVLHEKSGVPFERIRFVQGDSARIPEGGGTGGSRSATMQSNSINFTVDAVIARFRPLAEDELEVAPEDLVFEDGAFRIAGTDREIGLAELAEVARRAGKVELLTTRREFVTPGRSYPNGAHVCEVEVDRETGRCAVVKYTVVDDFGYLLNPMLVEGQVHGGVAQGIGQAVTEQVSFSDEGQLLSGSFMDYAMPRASDVPSMAFFTELVPSTANPIGMKGCGEAGTVGALAAVTNAALDAVWAAGVRHVDMPLTPLRVWEWLQAAQASEG